MCYHADDTTLFLNGYDIDIVLESLEREALVKR